MAHLLNLFIYIVYTVFLFGPPAIVKRVLWNRICPSFSTFLPSFCPSFHLFGCFLGIVSLVFSKFWHGSRNLNEVMRDRARFSGEIDFCPKNWGNGPKMSQQQVILDLLKNLVINFYWICSIIKMQIICCILAQILHLGNFCFWDTGQNVLGQSDCRIF